MIESVELPRNCQKCWMQRFGFAFKDKVKGVFASHRAVAVEADDFSDEMARKYRDAEGAHCR